MTQGQLTHPTYRPDIDGLRAVAVMAVVLFHAFPKHLPGGYIGVDIFFVISGFLISSILFKNLEAERFSFLTFYQRRVRRIFPALCAMMAATLGFSALVLLPLEFAQLGNHIAHGAGFVANLLLWSESGYFDNAAETKPLLHLWSLGIEEQFYIFWPLIVWAGWKRRVNLARLTLALLFVSFAANIIESRHDLTADFYSPLTRFWELLIGAFLAHAALRPFHWSRRVRDALSLGGAGLIAASLALVTKDSVFPGFWAILPTCGAAALIAAGPSGPINRALLARPALVWLGLISFPLYLWHWPLLSFARIIADKSPSYIVRVLLIVLSILLAWATTQFIEKPLRFGPRGNRKALGLLAAITVTGFLGFATSLFDGMPARMAFLSSVSPEKLSQITAAMDDWTFPSGLSQTKQNGFDLLAKPTASGQTTLFLGDSNIQQYAPRLIKLADEAPQQTNSILLMTEGGCVPLPRTIAASHKACDGFFETGMTYALAQDEVRRVVIGAQWLAYLTDRGWAFDGQRIAPRNEAYRAALSALGAAMDELRGKGKQVDLILNIPIGDEMNPHHMIARSLWRFPHIFDIAVRPFDKEKFTRDYAPIREDLVALATAHGARVIDPMAALCPEGTCAIFDAAGAPLYKDNTHLRATFVRDHADFIDQTVQP